MLYYLMMQTPDDIGAICPQLEMRKYDTSVWQMLYTVVLGVNNP